MKKWRIFRKWTIQTIESVIGAAVILTIFLNINVDIVIPGNSQHGFWMPLVTLSGVYIIMLSFLVIPISAGSVCSNYIPACISVNLRRKDALLGLQLVKVMSSLCCVLLGLAAFWAAGWPLSDGKALPSLQLLLCCLCIDLILTSAGNMFVAFSGIFQKVGIIIMSIFFAVIGGCIGIFFAKTMKRGIGEMLDLASFRIPVWVVVLAIVILLLDIIASKKYLDKMEIHS